MNDSVKDQIFGILSFNAGSLPIRYLGVPLISSRLKKSDCKILVEKIVARARSWASRALSYAGRLQLVNSILFAIQTSKGLSKAVAARKRMRVANAQRLSRRCLFVSALVFLLAKLNLFPADPLNERPISGRPDDRKVQELISYISPVSLLETRLTTLDPHEYPKTRRPFILQIRPPPNHPFLQSINPSGRPLPDRNPERVPQRAGI